MLVALLGLLMVAAAPLAQASPAVGSELWRYNFDSCRDGVNQWPTEAQHPFNDTGLVSDLGNVSPPSLPRLLICSKTQTYSGSLSTSGSAVLDRSTVGNDTVTIHQLRRSERHDFVGGQQMRVEWFIKSNGSVTVEGPDVALWWSYTPAGIQGPVIQGVAPCGFVNENGWRRWHANVTIPSGTITQPNNPPSLNVRLRIRQSSSEGSIFVDNFSMRYVNHIPGGILGDPQFVGLRGQSYQIHGIDGAVYNLVSSPTTQVNSRFVFLNSGKCPIFDGIPAKNCWAHPGSYLGSIGVQQVVDGVNHKLEIAAGLSTQGFESVTLDGQSMSVDGTFEHGDAFSIEYVSSHMVVVNTPEYTFTYENSDKFINQAVDTRVPLSQLASHGLFGQTHKNAVYPTKVKYIQGEVDDYMIADDDIFGSSFLYNKFQQ